MASMRVHRPWIKLTVLALSVVLTLLAIEMFLAVTNLAQRNNAMFVPGKGGIYVPNSAYRHVSEGFSEGHFNSHGFRDYERTVEKPPGVFRIAIFGDSSVEALQVDLADSFPALTDRHFDAAHPSRKIEVLAFGYSGFGTSDELMCYLNYGAKFSPDVVVLTFLAWNDFRNNHPRLSPGDIRFFHEVDADGRLVVNASRIDEYEATLTPPKRAFQTIRRHSYLLSMLSGYLFRERRQKQLAQFEAAGKATLPSPSTASGNAPISANSSLNIYLEDPAPVWDGAFENTARVLEEFNREVQARGSQFVIVTLSGSRQVHPERQAIMEAKHGARFDYGRPDRFIEQTASELGVPFLKLYPLLLQHHLDTGEYVHGFNGGIAGHWNEVGHRVAAEHLFTFLEPFTVGAGQANRPPVNPNP